MSDGGLDARRMPQSTGGAALAGLSDRAQWVRLSDWLAVAIAVLLPWSTSWTLILIAIWFRTRVAIGDHAAGRRVSLTAAGGLPLALFVLGGLGMLWADAPWEERLDGASGFYKLVALPLLLVQFRNSE